MDASTHLAPVQDSHDVPRVRKPSPVTEAVRRQPLLTFFVLAFALTWAALPWNSFLAAGPLLAALLVTGIADGRRGLREFGSRIVRWRVSWKLYAAAILIPLGLALATGAANIALGAPGSAIRNLQFSSLAAVFAARLVLPVGAPLGEEPGWRGFALPRLLEKRSPIAATLLLGGIVALWHVPLIWVAGENLPPLFIPTTVAVTFFYTWLFLRSGGSVFLTILAHAVEGTVAPQFTKSTGFAGADKSTWVLLYAAGWFAVAIALVLLDRQLWRRRRGATLGQQAPPRWPEISGSPSPCNPHG
jgi:membrane protease YdiL (CAAX protease family)